MGKRMEAITGLFEGWAVSQVDIGVMLGYMLLMMVVGWRCKSISKNISDYVRMGCKSTWWLMGTSIFMLITSAGAFTGEAGQAFMSGWSFILFSAGLLFGYIVMALFFAPWMRRTRAITPTDTIRMRYGAVVEQCNAYISMVVGMIWGGVWLFGFAIFMAVVFHIPVPVVIVFIGFVVIFYSVSGGSWSVQITDTLQAYVLIPIALVVLFLSLKEVGGISGLFQSIEAHGLAEDYKIIMPVGHQYTTNAVKVGAGYFSIGWLIAQFAYRFLVSANMTASWRFLSCKTDGDARKAALLAGVLLFLGSFVWNIPAMVGRIQYEDEILALGQHAEMVSPTDAAEYPEPTGNHVKLSNPADGAYAVVAKNVLPPGLMGLVVIGLLAATMSSLDSAMTGNAGIICHNVYPPLMRLLGKEPWTGRKLLMLTRVVNFFSGIWAIALALLFWKMAGAKSIFDIGLNIMGLVATPMVSAMVLSFFVKKLAWWAPLAGMGIGMGSSLFFMFAGPLAESMAAVSWIPDGVAAGISTFGDWINGLMWHQKIFITLALSILPALGSVFFWKNSTPEYRARVDTFFKQLRTPIDFEKEVGEPMDNMLLKMIGKLGLVIAGGILLLLFFAKDTEGHCSGSSILSILFVAAFIGTLSTIMLLTARKKTTSLTKRNM